MAAIDLAVPMYRAMPHPRAKEAMDALLAYSTCSCFGQNSQLAFQLYETAKIGKKFSNGLPSANPFHHQADCPYGKHHIHVIPQVNASIVHWSRNNLLQNRRKEADYVLFCDDDIVLQKNALEVLMRYKKDVVAGLCTKRVDPPEPNFLRWMEELQTYGTILTWPHGKFMEVDAIGTGVMLLSRRVIEDVAMAYHPECYQRDGNGFWFEFLKTPQGTEFGEDISFCYKAQRLGYKIYADTGLISYHMGEYNFGVEDYLQYQESILKLGGLAAFRQRERERATAQWLKPIPETAEVSK